MKRRHEPERPPEWNECSTFESWVETMLRQGYEAIVLDYIKVMPEEQRAPYRGMWKRIVAKLKAEGSQGE